MGNTCPHCSLTPCLSLWRKLTLGPTGTVPCQICGYKVGLDPMRALLVMLPLFLLVISITGGVLTNVVAAVAILLVLLPVSGLLYAYWIPLRAREVTDRRLVESARTRIATKKERDAGA